MRCLTAGPEVAAQLPAVRQLLPGARVQICRAQGLETLFSKAQELGGAGREDPGLWPRLCRLAGASSPAAYSEALSELRAHGPAAFVEYFERNWAPRRDMWVRFRAFEAARDLDACALVRSHRRRLLRRLSPSRGVAQCLRDLVAMQWTDAAGEAVSDRPEVAAPWPEAGPGRDDQLDQENTKGLEAGAWGEAPKEGSLWRGPPLEKEWVRGLERQERTGALLESDHERGWPLRDCRGGAVETPKPRALQGHPWRAGQQEVVSSTAPEIRDWRGRPWQGENQWSRDRALRAADGFALRTAPSEEHRMRSSEEEHRMRSSEAVERKGAAAECQRPRGVGGNPWTDLPTTLEERETGLNPRDWPALQVASGQGRGLEAGLWRGHPLTSSPELAQENGDPRAHRWREVGEAGPETGEERGAKLGFPRRDPGEVVLVQLGNARGPSLENGVTGGAQPGDSQSRGKPEGDPGVGCSAPVGSVFEGEPEWAVTSGVYAAAAPHLQEPGEGESPQRHWRPRRSPEEQEPDWEPLAKFRAACGPELAGLVAEELAFARRHGTRGFRWTGTGFALQDGTSDFVLDRALTRCSCSIHAAHRLPCRHIFAARLLTGAALFHMDLLRDCWGRVPEP